MWMHQFQFHNIVKQIIMKNKLTGTKLNKYISSLSYSISGKCCRCEQCIIVPSALLFLDPYLN
jgi:hypothetical protein